MIQGLTKSRLALALSLALGASSMAYAADTTSSIRGTIVGPNGQPAPHTKIMLLHQPSGTVTEVETNDNGAFSASGLRVGGPYRIIVDSDTYQDITKDGVFLQLGQTLRFNQQLNAAQDVEKITVVGSAVAFSSNAGSSSVFGQDAINNAPTFSRDLKEVVRANPLATSFGGDSDEFSVAGTNPRFNSISIDGVGINDDFGLNSNGYPTQRSPVSLDAVEQISIDTMPFNAKYGGFTGARINAVTKSGTNEFHGTLRYEHTDDDWAGDYENPSYKPDDPTSKKHLDVNGVDSDMYSFNLGGPIIKDKLFFFVNYEKYKKPTVNDWGPEGSGAGNPTGFTEEQYNQVKQIASDRYGIDNIGGWTGNPDEEDEKWQAKIDWNINATQRMAFTYSSDDSNSIRNLTDSDQTLHLSSNWYNYQQKMDAYTVHFYSDWTSDFSTEFAVSYKDVKSLSGIATRDYGTVTIDNNPEVVDGRPRNGDTVVFGPDNYRHANKLETKTWKANLDAEYLIGDHKLSFGGQYERLDIYNLFIEGTLGVWKFESIDDFANGNGTLDYGNAYTNNEDDGAAQLVMGTYAAYIQDDWAATSNLDLSFGVRYERVFSDDKPTFNQNFYDRYGFSNQENMDGTDIFLPRLGFTWYATDALTIKGGAGRFAGGTPNVWISNSFSKDGVTVVKTEGNDLTNVTSLGVPDSIRNSLVSGDGETDVIDPDFDIPSEWRYALGFDYNFDIPYLGDDWTWSSQYIYTQKEDSLAWRELNRKDSGNRTADGRVIWEPVDASVPDHYDIMLTNADRDGYSNVVTTSLNKHWDSGFDLNMSYTYQDVTDGNTGTSSQAASNYKYDVVASRNIDYMGRGSYEIEHSFKLTLGYTHNFFEDYATRFNVFFERRSGKPYGWIMNTYTEGALGDQYYLSRTSAYTPYIPTGPNDPNVDFTDPNGLTYDELYNNYIEPNGLGKYAGGFVPKNASRTPWVTTMDVSVQQEIPGLMEGHKGTLYLTIQNFANLLNDDWGHVESAGYNKEFTEGSWNDNGQLVYADNSRYEDGYDFESEQSVWYLKVGVSYSF